MKRFLLFLMTVCLYLTVNAQALAPMTWTAYGLTFNAPKGILVEEQQKREHKKKTSKSNNLLKSVIFS